MGVADETYKSIWLDDSGTAVRIIDKTDLPHKFAVRKLSNLEEISDAIKHMQVRGAPLIGVAAAFGKYLAMCENSSDHNVEAAYERDPGVNGLILLNHGIITFSDDAESSYQHMIDAISTVEEKLANANKRVSKSISLPCQLKSLADVDPIIRGVCIAQDERIGKNSSTAQNILILEFRSSNPILEFANGKESQR